MTPEEAKGWIHAIGPKPDEDFEDYLARRFKEHQVPTGDSLRGIESKYSQRIFRQFVRVSMFTTGVAALPLTIFFGATTVSTQQSKNSE
jgi:hypothetical protein